MARKKIQGPMLTYMLEHPEGVRGPDLAKAVSANSSSMSGALNRLKGNGVIGRKGNLWVIKDREEAIWLTNNTYHTKNREGPRVVGVMTQPLNGEIKMGDLFEMIGRLRDGSRLVRTLDSGIVYKLEEV